MERQKYEGLNDSQVLESRKLHGENILTPPAQESLWKKFFGKFKDPLIIILLVAGGLSLLISFYEFFVSNESFRVFFEPLGIFVAILLAVSLAFIFEVKADNEFNILNKVNDDESVRVIRNSNVTEIPKKDVVVGDILIIESGAEVAADAELLEATSLKIDESSLTGEPICEKTVSEKEFDPEATFPSNHVMKGTKVMEGHGICKVFAVGDKTENGKVFEAAQIDSSVKTPLNRQLDGLSKLISKISYSFAILIIIGRLIIFFSTNDSYTNMELMSFILHTVMIAVTLVVVSVPEGLPMAVTLSLAYSMRKMLKTNNLVRKLHACETMGSTTVICTDKTGTLTKNQMSVNQYIFFHDEKDEITTKLLEEGIAVNSTASLDLSDEKNPKAIGNPTEGALLLWLRKRGVDYKNLKNAATVRAEIPFSTERKYMATLVHSSIIDKDVLYVKGAPEIIYSLCSKTQNNVSKEQIDKYLLEFQSKAMRTLAFAYQILEDEEQTIDDERLIAKNLTFAGIVAIMDPVRDDVPQAVENCLRAGIDIKIVTGDTQGTAKEIGRQIGIWTEKDNDDNIITGPEFAALSDEELKKRIGGLKIISRARPMDKKRLVETLQGKGEVVAVTGDGTNDAPALKAAHVGLSMGDGTSVAKEASDITIIDNSFASIGRAVMWGRSLYKNIQRFILFQVTVNVVACLIVLVGAFMGTKSPLTVTQMLWVNLIMDTFAAVALASLPPEESVMREKPRKREDFIINKTMRWNIISIGILFFVFMTGLFYIFQRTDIHSVKELFSISFGTSDQDISLYERSLFFTIFVMLQFWNMFNARAFATGHSAFHFKNCSGFVTIALLILLGQIIIVSIGGEMFSVMPLSIEDWLLIILSTSVVLWIGELIRILKKLAKN